MSTNPPVEPAWHTQFPPPNNKSPPSITREELLKWLSDPSAATRKFQIVDVRRTDFEGGTIRGSINLPAQSLYQTRAALYSLFSAAKIEIVVWYCGSSKGRGTRAAGWFDDYIKEQGDESMRSVILEGGVTGWAGAGEEYVRFMDGYLEDVWKRPRKEHS